MLIITVSADPIVPQTVFGDDDRTIISSTTTSPYNAVANLIITQSDGAVVYGTGFLIGPNTIATSAHCLYDYQEGTGRIRQIKIKLGDNPSADPYGTITVTDPSRFHYPSQWTSTGSIQYDYAAVTFPTSVSITPFTLSSTQTLSEGTTIKISGYDWYSANQYLSSGSIREVGTYAIESHVDTLAGQSGSPVYVGTRTVVGIHSRGYGEYQDDDYADNNQAARITSTAKSFLESYT